jgi:predicted nucleotidyltransferase
LKQKNISAIQDIFINFPEIDEVILYGSRAKGNYVNGSDIDLSLIGNNLTLHTLLKIEHQIDELYLPYQIDFSLFHRIENPALIEHIKRCGKVFFEKVKTD